MSGHPGRRRDSPVDPSLLEHWQNATSAPQVPRPMVPGMQAPLQMQMHVRMRPNVVQRQHMPPMQMPPMMQQQPQYQAGPRLQPRMQMQIQMPMTQSMQYQQFHRQHQQHLQQQAHAMYREAQQRRMAQMADVGGYMDALDVLKTMPPLLNPQNFPFAVSPPSTPNLLPSSVFTSEKKTSAPQKQPETERQLFGLVMEPNIKLPKEDTLIRVDFRNDGKDVSSLSCFLNGGPFVPGNGIVINRLCRNLTTKKARVFETRPLIKGFVLHHVHPLLNNARLQLFYQTSMNEENKVCERLVYRKIGKIGIDAHVTLDIYDFFDLKDHVSLVSREKSELVQCVVTRTFLIAISNYKIRINISKMTRALRNRDILPGNKYKLCTISMQLEARHLGTVIDLFRMH